MLSWRLEFFELLTQFTSGCPRTGSLSTRARHNSYGSEQSAVLPREIQIAFPVYLHPWLSLHPWGTLVSSLTKNSPWKIILPNSASRVITSSVKYVQFGIHLHKLPSKPWSMLSSAHASILETASSMGQARTSLTVSSRSLTLLHVKIGKYDPISSVIRRDLHWLPIRFRFHFKLNSITSNCLAGRAPEYLTELCHSVNDMPARRNLRSSSQVQLLVPRFWKERSGRRGFSVSSP